MISCNTNDCYRNLAFLSSFYFFSSLPAFSISLLSPPSILSPFISPPLPFRSLVSCAHDSFILVNAKTSHEQLVEVYNISLYNEGTESHRNGLKKEKSKAHKLTE